MFGGVHDIEESEEGIDSEFFDELYAWNVERNRFFPLTLRRTQAGPKKQLDDRAKKDRGKADETELLRNLAALERKGTVTGADVIDVAASEDEEEAPKPAKPRLNAMPHRRYNAQLAVQGDLLYIFAGTYEQGDREYTFDEMHAINLARLDGVHEIYKRELDNWHGEDGASDSDSEDEDGSKGGEDDGHNPARVSLPEAEINIKPEVATMAGESVDEREEEPLDSTLDDSRPHPRPFESLRDFFARTSMGWQEIVLERPQGKGDAVNQSVKELRKTAFELAEIKWWDCREEVNAEEERQEDAGIGEVISLFDRTKEGGDVARRR